MSGSATSSWAFHSREVIRNSSISLARFLNCDVRINETDNLQVDQGDKNKSKMMQESVSKDMAMDRQIVLCLKNLSASDIVKAGLKVYCMKRD